jgi:bifunctional non-homologous end joining protein LigD
MAIHDEDGLRALVQTSVLELHTWGCHADLVDRADWWVFDLDPDPAVAWPEVVRAAFDVRARLREVALESWVKTTGGKGLHVCVPVARRLDWEETKVLCASFANEMVRSSPSKYVATITKAKRQGKILLDHFRNGRGATAVAPYSTRARAGAPVAMPLTWSQLEKTGDGERPVFDVAGVLARGLPKVDPWKGAESEKQSTTAAARAYLAARKRHG